MVKLAVVLTTTTVVAVMWAAMPAGANPPYVPQGPFVSPSAGNILPMPPNVPGKEYSSHSDRDHWHVGDPEQVLNWDGAGGTYDGWDYTGSRIGSNPPDTADRQVDALANEVDALYHEVIGDLSHLLISVDQDPNIYYERRLTGATGVWADQSISQPDGAPGADVDVGAAILDVDGLEVWGPEPPYLAGGVPPFIGDANRYSLGAGVPADPLGVSVWDVSLGVPALALWSTVDIAGIVGLASGFTVNPMDINLDGMMTWGLSDIMFTIDPDPTGLFDGGEIFVGKRQGGPGSPIVVGAFLWHGGHLWNTAFNVMATFGVQNENVNALEAVSTIPEPTTLVLVGCALLSIVGLRRCGCKT